MVWSFSSKVGVLNVKVQGLFTVNAILSVADCAWQRFTDNNMKQNAQAFISLVMGVMALYVADQNLNVNEIMIKNNIFCQHT